MANQVEYEAFIHHHNQKLMREAKMSRSLSGMRQSSADMNRGVISIFSWLKRQLRSDEPVHQDQFIDNAKSEQKLFTG
jgi:hypothetical protein